MLEGASDCRSLFCNKVDQVVKCIEFGLYDDTLGGAGTGVWIVALYEPRIVTIPDPSEGGLLQLGRRQQKPRRGVPMNLKRELSDPSSTYPHASFTFVSRRPCAACASDRAMPRGRAAAPSPQCTTQHDPARSWRGLRPRISAPKADENSPTRHHELPLENNPCRFRQRPPSQAALARCSKWSSPSSNTIMAM